MIPFSKNNLSSSSDADPADIGQDQSKKRNFLQKYILNRYTLVVVASLVWLAFFDQFDFRSQIKLRQKIQTLEAQKAEYQQEITVLRQERDLLNNDPGELERIARENYLMKRPNEDVYIIVPDSQ